MKKRIYYFTTNSAGKEIKVYSDPMDGEYADRLAEEMCDQIGGEIETEECTIEEASCRVYVIEEIQLSSKLADPEIIKVTTQFDHAIDEFDKQCLCYEMAHKKEPGFKSERYADRDFNRVGEISSDNFAVRVRMKIVELKIKKS